MECTLSTLVELFDQQREHLCLRLGDHPDSEHTVREVKTCLGSLLTAYGQEKDHPLTERRLCGFLLDAVSAAVATLAGYEVVTDQHQGSSPTPSSSRSTERGRWLLRGVYVVIAVALAGLLFQDGALTALALLGALVLLSVREWFSHPSPPAVPALQPSSRPRMVVDVNRLLAQLREAMKAVDAVMAEASKPPAVATSALEEDGTLLDLMHELLRAAYAEDGVYALKHLNTLTFVFARQGVTLQNFTAENHHLFDTVPDLNPHSRTWRTLKPALVKKDGRLLRRGLVAEPTVSKEHLH
jgi:hypothetical protein